MRQASLMRQRVDEFGGRVPSHSSNRCRTRTAALSACRCSPSSSVTAASSCSSAAVCSHPTSVTSESRHVGHALHRLGYGNARAAARRRPWTAAPTPAPPVSAPVSASASSALSSSYSSAAASAAELGSGAGRAEFEFVCPICLTTSFKLAAMPSESTGLCCPRCGRTFPASPAYLDLTTTSGVNQRVYSQRAWGGTELFRNPLVSFAYERGWRQGFAWAGFPGADAEYDMAMSYLMPAGAGKVLVDMSCGSGLFSRRFARSGSFAGVVAADFSESMLQQTREYCRAEGEGRPGSTPIMLLRADVGRLPFATGSVAALHAGAAIHCWPNPQAALAEISRVLAPGGVFVASTFLTATAPLGAVLGDDAVRPLNKLDPTTVGGAAATPYRWWEEAELRELCEAVGLVDFRRQRQWRFILFAATKPGSPPPPAAPGAPDLVPRPLTDLE